MKREIEELPLGFKIERLEGGEGDRPDFFPAQSVGYAVQGFSRSLVLISHFAATGKVKRRPPYDESVIPLVGPAKSGSLDISFLLEIVRSTVNDYGIEVTRDFFVDLLSYSISSLIGKKQRKMSKNIEKIVADRGGEAHALMDSIEAPIRISHSPIINSNVTINISTGERNIVELDEKTKNFIEYEEFVDNIDVEAAIVSALNVNSKSGRVYLFEEEKSVPFRVPREANKRTIRELSKSLNKYASNQLVLRPRDI